MDEIREAVLNELNLELAFRLCMKLFTEQTGFADCNVQFMSIDDRDALVGYITFGMWANNPITDLSLATLIEDYYERTKKSQ